MIEFKIGLWVAERRFGGGLCNSGGVLLDG
jgi:hypothetical protein